MHDTLPLLESLRFPEIQRRELETLQANLDYKCNQRCIHCHVNAGPHRTEVMDEEVLSLIIPVLKSQGIGTLDLTGGAPELHPGFRRLVSEARQEGIRVLDRCNLTILFEPGQEDLGYFLAENKVEIVASLPCYSLDNVDKQRGDGAFDKGIKALQLLNALGYGKEGSGLVLNLVYNPQGPSLPPDQQTLGQTYKLELHRHFGIIFNELFTLANMPIRRFGSVLVSRGAFDDYMQLLQDNHVPENLDQVMCGSLIGVDWRGRLYDCDCNQPLDLPVPDSGCRHLRDLLNLKIARQPIRTSGHYFGCTAGQGSGCGGAFRE